MLVSWLFLAFAVWTVLWTIVSFHPPHRPAPLMVVGFFAAWTTTELAPFHLAWQIALSAVFVWFGALESWIGWVALAVLVSSWIALGASVKGSWQTDNVFVNAMRDALGPHWDDNLDPALEMPLRRARWTRVLLPFWFRRRGVERVRNLHYIEGDDSRRHRLDVYRPKSVRTGAPVLLQIHGGAWMISNKDQQGKPLLYHLAARGWVCVAINYRLSPRSAWPAHIVDCKRALAWIRDHVAEYGGDPGYVVVTGGSAGGHLTALVGLTANDPEWQPGFEDVDTSVRAMIPFYGVFDWTGVTPDGHDNGLREMLEKYVVKQKYDDAPEVFRDASPYFRISPDAPPALVIHGDLDTLAPIGQARAFVDKLRATSGNPVVFAELKGAHHAFEVYNSVRTVQVIAGVDLFLAWLLNVTPVGLSPSGADPSRNDATAPAENGPRPTARTEP